ncbi:LANO_0B06788g1_1 [Lachancea nothofagi CBS 11611]|uniref:LANO_0B06788g1_1 n=1 Tax=Lachancea nothofagi CBS 11611 TaxID=1266666 RepID=A0A1G4IZ84_9SACH|nr:LANO_0B06788g1_1 [Lachancea nothofagi CBS 11611]
MSDSSENQNSEPKNSDMPSGVSVEKKKPETKRSRSQDDISEEQDISTKKSKSDAKELENSKVTLQKQPKQMQETKPAVNAHVQNQETTEQSKTVSEKNRDETKTSQPKSDERETTKAKSAESKVQKALEKPKFAFGASSNFSAGFGIAKNDSDESKSSDTSSAAANKAEKPAAFGSGFAFGAGFHALNKDKSTSSTKVFENETEKAGKAEKAKSASSTPTSANSDDKNNGAERDGVVKLTKQDVKSGEESEESVYQVNAKLYQLTDLKEGWKERGVGALHVNLNRHTGKGRLVMRSRGILKVIMNVSLVKGVAVHKGFPASLNGEKFIRIVTVDHEKTPVQYAVKTGKAETATELHDNIVKLIPS